MSMRKPDGAWNNVAYFTPLVSKPIIVTGPGQYKTRAGEIVTVNVASRKNDMGCRGLYPNGIADGWHRSGRIFANIETENDIVARVKLCRQEMGQGERVHGASRQLSRSKGAIDGNSVAKPRTRRKEKGNKQALPLSTYPLLHFQEIKMGKSGSIENRLHMILELERIRTTKQAEENKELERQKQDLCREKLRELRVVMEAFGYDAIRDSIDILIYIDETTIKNVNFK